ncbi:IclR family transcriptional regulator [Halarchaeum nitratireducens]|nr:MULTISPECIES: IclR family transcriptional regulator C-terminal domain-containing protein [Halarchaeum]MBP2251066.1 DNA-binding IclR family transcriptional regulator [Halarchaeum solikamskense]
MSERRVGSDETLFRIVEGLDAAGDAGVTELAEQLSLSKSTVHRHLQTLAACGFAVNEDGRYRLSHAWFRLGTRVRFRGAFYRAARDEIRTLSAETGHTTWSAIEEDGRLMFVDGAGSNPTPSPELLVGDWADLDETAAGKAILAHLPEPRIERFVETRAAESGDAVRKTIRASVTTTRDRGYAVNREGHISGIYALGMPVIVDRSVRGGLSLASASPSILNAEHDELVDALAAAVRRVERALTDQDDG